MSTPSGRVAQSPTEQAWTVTQHQGPARSGRARGGHQVPVGTTGAITPRLSPLPALPERIVAWASAGGHGRQRSPWTQTARPQELAKPQRTRFRTAPTAILFLFIKIHREDPVLDRVARVEIDRTHNPSSPP